MADDAEHLFLDYATHQIHYNTRLRFPSCVVERFTEFPRAEINRESFTDKFHPDPNIIEHFQHKKEDYKNYIIHGGSYGHHAPASFHKSTDEEYLRTFWFSNICPQEGTFNAGLWQLVEKWAMRVIEHYGTVTVLTGSIADLSSTSSTFHIPSHMYKIIIIHHDGRDYINAYCIPNRRHFDVDVKISKWCVDTAHIEQQLITCNNFVLSQVLKSLSSYSAYQSILVLLPELDKIKGLAGLDIIATKNIRLSLRHNEIYGHIIYANSLEELEAYVVGKKLNKNNLKYYNMARTRLKQDVNIEKCEFLHV